MGLRIRGKVSDEAYERQQGFLVAERQWMAEERERISKKLTKLDKQSVSLVGLEQLREQMRERLLSGSFADRRFILEALKTRVIVTTEGCIEVEFAIPGNADRNGAIVLNIPLNACPQYSVVPKTSPL